MQAGRDREMHFVKEKTEDFKPVAATTYQSVSEMTKGKFFRFFFFFLSAGGRVFFELFCSLSFITHTLTKRSKILIREY